MAQAVDKQSETIKTLTKILGRKGMEIAFGLACQLACKSLRKEDWELVAADWLAVAQKREWTGQAAFSIKWYRPYALALSQPVHNETQRVFYASLKDILVRKKEQSGWREIKVPQKLLMYRVADDLHDLASAFVVAVEVKPLKKKARRKLVKKATPAKAKRPRVDGGSGWTMRILDKSLS